VQGLFDEMGLIVGWRAIAHYMGRSISTVKRYEKTYGLPVRRWCSGRPMAFKHEIDRYCLAVDKLFREQMDKDRASAKSNQE
jgi:hypothetical protein